MSMPFSRLARRGRGSHFTLYPPFISAQRLSSRGNIRFGIYHTASRFAVVVQTRLYRGPECCCLYIEGRVLVSRVMREVVILRSLFSLHQSRDNRSHFIEYLVPAF